MCAEEQKQEEQAQLRKDIIHIVNVLICKARDGEYNTPAHEKMYAQFTRMVGRFLPWEIDQHNKDAELGTLVRRAGVRMLVCCNDGKWCVEDTEGERHYGRDAREALRKALGEDDRDDGEDNTARAQAQVELQTGRVDG